jgi:hypothetical protein
LARCIKIVERKQHPDGSWSIDWAAELRVDAANDWSTDPQVRSYRLLATSHLAEILLYLPSDLQVPPDVVGRAAGWLYQALRRATRDEILEGYCPHAHAAAVVRQVSFSPGMR